jgi:PleD family two-component response regulator
VSIGKAKYLSSIKTVKEFIDAADDELYKVKKALKVGR